MPRDRNNPRTKSAAGKPRTNKRFQISPVELDEFMFAFGVAHAAASLTMPVENPSAKAIKLRVDDDVLTLRLTDRPMNRAGMAVIKHFKGDKFRVIMARLLALNPVFKDPKVASWIRTANGREEVAESLLAAGAKAPLTTRLKFNVDDIVRLAAKYDKDHDFD